MPYLVCTESIPLALSLNLKELRKTNVSFKERYQPQFYAHVHDAPLGVISGIYDMSLLKLHMFSLLHPTLQAKETFPLPRCEISTPVNKQDSVIFHIINYTIYYLAIENTSRKFLLETRHSFIPL